MGNANDTDSVFCFDAATGRVTGGMISRPPNSAHSTSATPTVVRSLYLVTGRDVCPTPLAYVI